jgi:hypothetical protein
MKKYFLLLLISFFVVSCGGSTTGNPISVSLRMVDQQPFAWWRPVRSLILIPEAHAAASSVYFCFKRLRFKANSSGGGEDIDLEIGRVAIDANGTDLTSIRVPAGTYERIEFDLEEECDGTSGRPSVEFVNTNAPFNHSTTDRMTIKFDGSVTISADTTLELNIDLFYDEMDSFSSSDDIKTLFEALSGDF